MLPLPQALLLQRWPISRVVVNEDAVLAALRAADFDARAFVPEQLPLAELLVLLRGASLLVCVHGAGMINQARCTAVAAFRVDRSRRQLRTCCAIHAVLATRRYRSR